VGQRLQRLEQERMARERSEHARMTTEHAATVATLHQQLAELRHGAREATAAHDEAFARGNSQMASLQDRMKRMGAMATVRLIAVNQKRKLARSFATWCIDMATSHATADAASKSGSQSVPHPAGLAQQNLIMRATERAAHANDNENKSPQRSASVEPLQKAIDLRQRLQEHVPRGLATSTPKPTVTRRGEKGALLRGLRLRLDQ